MPITMINRIAATMAMIMIHIGMPSSPSSDGGVSTGIGFIKAVP